MVPKILHIYGPININSYGLVIALSLLFTIWLANKDPKRKRLISAEQFNVAIILGILSALIGGRLLHLGTSWSEIDAITDIFVPWYGGFSILGSIIAVFLTIPFYLHYIKVPILPCLDFSAIYAPLLQGLSRIGCFFAGCCYGKVTGMPWGFVYQNIECIAPLYVPLHPTQLYSTFALLTIFTLMYFFFQYWFTKPGQLFTLYLMMASGERFSIDFFRANQTFFQLETLQLFSINQWVALGIFTFSAFLFIILSRTQKYKA